MALENSKSLKPAGTHFIFRLHWVRTYPGPGYPAGADIPTIARDDGSYD
jgi:hypothetical protein